MATSSVFARSYTLFGCAPGAIQVRETSNGKTICRNAKCLLSSHVVARELYRTILSLHAFFSENYDMCGIDGLGGIPELFIGWDQNNAQWECGGSQCRWRFNDRYARMPAVVAHEYTHGVLDESNSLSPFGETGALQESLSDVLGIAFKHWSKRGRNWKIVDRDLAVHIDMSSFRKGRRDNGFVHDNSRIPSHAFYIATQEIEERSWGVISHIWLAAMQTIDYDASFIDFALETLYLAKFCKMPHVEGALAKGWLDVQVFKITIPRAIKTRER